MHNLENAFWHFSISVYRESSVAKECLELQETLSANVNAMLFCAWVGSDLSLLLNAEDILAIRSATEQWHDSIVAPLRRVRKSVKIYSVTGDPAFQDLGKKMMDIELQAEQIEQALLYASKDELIRHSLSVERTDAIRGNISRYIGSLLATATYPLPATPVADHLIEASISRGAS